MKILPILAIVGLFMVSPAHAQNSDNTDVPPEAILATYLAKNMVECQATVEFMLDTVLNGVAVDVMLHRDAPLMKGDPALEALVNRLNDDYNYLEDDLLPLLREVIQPYLPLEVQLRNEEEYLDLIHQHKLDSMMDYPVFARRQFIEVQLAFVGSCAGDAKSVIQTFFPDMVIPDRG